MDGHDISGGQVLVAGLVVENHWFKAFLNQISVEAIPTYVYGITMRVKYEKVFLCFQDLIQTLKTKPKTAKLTFIQV